MTAWCRREFVQGVSLLGLPGGDVAATLFDTWTPISRENWTCGSSIACFGEVDSPARHRLQADDFAPLAMYRNTYVVKHTPRRNWSHRKVDGATNVVVHCKHGSDAP